MATTATQKTQPSSQPVYAGGNEVFFSFLQVLLDQVDQGHISQQAYDDAVKSWGRTLAQRAEVKGSLKSVIEAAGRMLATLGIVRTFDPLAGNRILVMRALDCRYVGAPRVVAGKPYRALAGLLLQGVLDQAGLNYSVQESRDGMVRADELLLTLSPRSC